MNTKLFLAIIALTANVSRAEMSGYDPHPVFSGSYSVPTGADLANFAVWKLKDITVLRNAGTMSVKYKMPSDLFEDAQEFTLEGKYKAGVAFFSLSGGKVQAACTEVNKDSYLCLLKFKKDIVKSQKEDYFKKAYSDASEEQKRVKVAQLFADDPVGILRIEKQ